MPLREGVLYQLMSSVGDPLSCRSQKVKYIHRVVLLLQATKTGVEACMECYYVIQYVSVRHLIVYYFACSNDWNIDICS